ncbi:adenylate/guanylate cyclase domain-containing protein [Georgenia sp. 10Sc9-8]|uniref:Adenylate/guanylate cyclase domain-containing protein n=1 Tax=Georgenia halotolerans TaxID=3028317 RepID=A0ABT5TZY0_9MICO|nr:adenylate/guanylate cyclase domain-containing protein [Georgenia halotolerans]
MSELPEGTITLLFSDIEGSTRLLARLGERYGEVLSTQRAVMRAAFAMHGGHEMGTEGDSFFVVFRTVGAAVRAAVQAQRALCAASWPDGVQVRVRMGVHTGEPTRHEDGYVGMDVHRAARVAAVAHGGQVVLTAATHRIATTQDDVEALDLGEHRLKDIPGVERLHQLCAPGLPRTFPPLRSLGSRSTLPLPPTAMVGRERELAEVRCALAEPVGGAVTLTGPGGVGKTRLALAVAAAVEGELVDGVYFVPLSAVRSEDVLWSSVAEALDVAGDRKDAEGVLQHVSGRQVLVVLDNLEQIPQAPQAVTRLVAAGRGVRVLATSRRPLHVPGEREHAVAPLGLPAPGASPAAAAASEALALFVQRATATRPDFRLTEEIVADVSEICRALDGLPLAIELVAARIKLLGPRALRARLDTVLELEQPTVGVPSRQRTLRAAIAWSHDLLGPDLREVFARLSVFSGWFDLPAVAAVVSTEHAGHQGDGLTPGLAELGELVDASLVTVRDGPDGEPHFRLLRTIAAFGRQALADSGHEAEVRRRHAEHYLALAEQVRTRLRSAGHLTARDRLESELDNVRAALTWTFDTGETTLALRLCEQLRWFWYACGYQLEGRRWLATAVGAAADEDSAELARARHGLAVLVLQQGEANEARDLLRQSLAYWRRVGEPERVAAELNSLAMAHRALGEADLARVLLEEAVTEARRGNGAVALADALSNLAALEIDAGSYASATTLLQEVLALDEAAGDAWGIAADHVNLAATLLRAGRHGEAAGLLRQHGAGITDLGDAELTVDLVELCCVLHAERGHGERAARLLGAVRALRSRTGLVMAEPDRAWLESRLAPVRERVGGELWAAGLAAGADLDARQLVDEALALP